jgi:hypothetical protein
MAPRRPGGLPVRLCYGCESIALFFQRVQGLQIAHIKDLPTATADQFTFVGLTAAPLLELCPALGTFQLIQIVRFLIVHL